MDLITEIFSQIIEEYIAKGEVKELCINKPEEIWVEDIQGKWFCYNDTRLSLSILRCCIRCLATTCGQEFSDKSPIISLTMPRGHRIQVVSGINTKSEFAICIRVNRDKTYHLEEYQYQQLNYTTDTRIINNSSNIGHLFASGANLLIAGGTGCGKTSLANSLLDELYNNNPNLRIVTIEGVTELRVKHHNHCSLLYSENNSGVGKSNIKDLLKASLRMRPDRLIIGELTTDNISIFSRVIESGHSGTLATIHASTPQGAFDAIIDNLKISGVISDIGAVTFLKKLKETIDGVVMIKKHNHLPVIEYIPTSKIAFLDDQLVEMI
jgi:type IV secretion system protein VirB11